MSKYHLYLGNEEHALVIESLVKLKNRLTAEGKYTDAVDDVLIKVITAPVKKLRVK